MDSISGACMLLSWFISNSYSKSEMARSPLTIALAFFSRAKSTIRLRNGSASTLGRCAVASAMNSQRSRALNSVLALRIGTSTTATIRRSNMPAARAITSRCPLVIGSYDPGQTAMWLSGFMDADQRVAVAALLAHRQCQLERCAAVALARYPSPWRQHGRQQRRQVARQPGGPAVWRVEEDEIVLTPSHACIAKEGPGVLAADLGRVRRPKGLQVPGHGAHRRGGAVHEGRGHRPPPPRLDPEAPRPGEEVEHREPGHVAQEREQRLADAIRRRAGGATRRRAQPAAAVASGDDPEVTAG